ncbi:hypothetical protein KKD19_06910 [Patescibacteria group bacterium]|nr:hypothetical protein [Patescibacteria group bacterium]
MPSGGVGGNNFVGIAQVGPAGVSSQFSYKIGEGDNHYWNAWQSDTGGSGATRWWLHNYLPDISANPGEVIYISAKDVSGAYSNILAYNPANQCGNNLVEAGEDCDDGNDIDGDGCNTFSTNCQYVCGDGIANIAGEICDDGGTSWTSGNCAADCSGINRHWVDWGTASGCNFEGINKPSLLSCIDVPAIGCAYPILAKWDGATDVVRNGWQPANVDCATPHDQERCGTPPAYCFKWSSSLACVAIIGANWTYCKK